MRDMIAYCGLDCEKCDAYLATLRDDQALREKTAEKWSAWNHVTILPGQIACEGCRTDGVKTEYCASLCAIRRCAISKSLPTCGSCPSMETCPTLAQITDNNPVALGNLKG